MELGIGVYSPHGDERCDFIFDLRPRLVRIQVKWANTNGVVIYARLYSARRARAGLIRKPYEDHEVDAFALYCADSDSCYFLDREAVAGRTQILLRLRGTRNNQAAGVNWAEDFEFAARLKPVLGAVAQLGERCHGMAEVRGSIPLGSTLD